MGPGHGSAARQQGARRADHAGRGDRQRVHRAGGDGDADRQEIYPRRRSRRWARTSFTRTWRNRTSQTVGPRRPDLIERPRGRAAGRSPSRASGRDERHSIDRGGGRESGAGGADRRDAGIPANPQPGDFAGPVFRRQRFFGGEQGVLVSEHLAQTALPSRESGGPDNPRGRAELFGDRSVSRADRDVRPIRNPDRFRAGAVSAGPILHGRRVHRDAVRAGGQRRGRSSGHRRNGANPAEPAPVRRGIRDTEPFVDSGDVARASRWR